TGVQTCALPILRRPGARALQSDQELRRALGPGHPWAHPRTQARLLHPHGRRHPPGHRDPPREARRAAPVAVADRRQTQRSGCLRGALRYGGYPPGRAEGRPGRHPAIMRDQRPEGGGLPTLPLRPAAITTDPPGLGAAWPASETPPAADRENHLINSPEYSLTNLSPPQTARIPS